MVQFLLDITVKPLIGLYSPCLAACLHFNSIFRCTLCGRAFKSANVLMTHKRDTHKIVGPNAKREEGTGRVESWRVWNKNAWKEKERKTKKKTRKKKDDEGSK